MKILTLLLFACISVQAQIRPVNLFLNKRDHERIDKELEKFVKSYKLPGLTFVLANKGRIVFSNAYGYADIKKKVKLEPKHRMSASVCTQIYTSAAIHKLIQEGKLSLEDRIFGPGGIFEKEVLNVRNYEQEITVRNLLEGTVGEEWSVKGGSDSHLKGATFPLKINNFLREVKLGKRINQRAYYSGICYYILGRVIEKKSEVNYIDYLKETLKDNMESDLTIIGDPNVKDVAIQYNRKLTPSNSAGSSYIFDSANGLVCSPVDIMNLFLSIDGDPLKPDALIPTAVKIMHSPSKIDLKVGKGWRIDQYGKFFFNWFTGNSTCIYSFEPAGLSWIIVVNGTSSKNNFPQRFMAFPDDLISKLKDIP